MKPSSPPAVPPGFLCVLCTLLALLHLAHAQNRTTTRAVTDPDEARALNSIFSKWGIKAQKEWNISGELCSGVAIDEAINIEDTAYDPFIKCDCSFNNSNQCHITALKVYALDVQGPIPEELWTLTSLTFLKLDQNILTGSLFSGIGNLTRAQTLSFGINALSGPIPREIGQLADLKILGLGSNNFSGALPADLGNCLKLEELYIDSSGLRGPIPPTFVDLQELKTVWATDVELTGSVPDFIGNWSKLTTLRIQGTSLDGPIPSSFANLTSLTELRISDLTSEGSSLEFIKDMKSLTVLVLRNNRISDTIPLSIGEFQSLQQLDLSFNNLRGPIPDSIFNITGLTHLFLGNNNLNGSLPLRRSSSLTNIDVSYNRLEGTLPSWVREPNLQLNLVVNNFTLEDSDSRDLLPGLNCLQRDFPCNRGTGIYYDFAINCGGPRVTSSSGLVFERDDAMVGPSSYFVSDSRRWAVCAVGLFTGSNNPRYMANSSSQFPNNLDSELFQTARLSASSLRYHGLALENGNYTVKLQFAEIEIQGNSTWQGLGRRIFDVYVQDIRVLKDFDILREAGGSLLRVVEMNFTAQVSENHLDIHFFWAGKGTCCIPLQGTYGPLVSAISVTPDFIPTVSNKPPTKKDDKTGIIAGIVVGVGVVGILTALAIFFMVRRRRRHADDEEELKGIDTKPYTFSYSELKGATQDFDSSKRLGEGGFGPVYKGKLNDGRDIAVKQLSLASGQGKRQFIAEIATISAVQHRNLVRLYGCCIEGDRRLLVYKYLPNRSLDQALFGETNLKLDWSTRYEICLGIARGLAYLHEESRLRIVHRDVKTSNILLDSDLVPKISDFGLAKLYDDKKSHISTRVAGTIGYLAPEYAMRGHLTEKADVFAFGVVALEIVSGRPNSDPSLDEDKNYLLGWAWNLYESGRELELVDSRVEEFNAEEVRRAIGVALLCIQNAPTLRPQMSRVVAMLLGDVEVGTVRSKPGYLTDGGFDGVSSFVTEVTKASGSTTSDNDSSSFLSNTPETQTSWSPSRGSGFRQGR